MAQQQQLQAATTLHHPTTLHQVQQLPHTHHQPPHQQVHQSQHQAHHQLQQVLQQQSNMLQAQGQGYRQALPNNTRGQHGGPQRVTMATQPPPLLGAQDPSIISSVAYTQPFAQTLSYSHAQSPSQQMLPNTITYTHAQSPPHTLVQQMQDLNLSNATYIPQVEPQVSIAQHHQMAQQTLQNSGPIIDNKFKAQFNHITDPNRPPRQWKPGDYCMAKYWEDHKYYRAIIQALGPNGQTCVIMFPDYGNSEEVYVTDIRAVPKQAWESNTIQPPTSAPMAVSGISGSIATPPMASMGQQASVPNTILVQNMPQSQPQQPQMATYMAYPSPNPAAVPGPPPTDQPYVGAINNMDFTRLMYGQPTAAMTRQQQQQQQQQQQVPRRPAQQLYVPPSHRPQPM
jgi:hypothetical protein